MLKYLDDLRLILKEGTVKYDRTGVGTVSYFGMTSRYRLTSGFPLITTKKVFIKGVIHELLWMISGSTNIKPLLDEGVHIWDEWADEEGNLGPVYGHQWRHWGEKEVDQLANVIAAIKADPFSRRHLVVAWNPSEVDDMALPPCHMMFQFNVREASQPERLAHAMKEKRRPLTSFGELWDKFNAKTSPTLALDCQMYQRSADMFLGVPFNIASYSLLTMMVAKLVNMVPGDFIHTIGDAHIYGNHREQVNEQLTRCPRARPYMGIKGDQETIDDFKYEDFVLIGYNPHPAIKADVAI